MSWRILTFMFCPLLIQMGELSFFNPCNFYFHLRIPSLLHLIFHVSVLSKDMNSVGMKKDFGEKTETQIQETALENARQTALGSILIEIGIIIGTNV